MSASLQVAAIAVLAATLTTLGAPLAERFDVPKRVVNAALQFAAGILAATVVLDLVPAATAAIAPGRVVLAFFIGGTLFVLFDYASARRAALRSDAASTAVNIGFFVGVLGDILVDGVVIGIGAALSVSTGLRLALGLAIAQLPMTFVSTATAKRQGMSEGGLRRLTLLYFFIPLFGTLLGYFVLRDRPETVSFTLIAGASGFLVTAVTQAVIPEAIDRENASLGGIMFVLGLSFYGLLRIVAA